MGQVQAELVQLLTACEGWLLDSKNRGGGEEGKNFAIKHTFKQH
jgi:hypothetical protein